MIGVAAAHSLWRCWFRSEAEGPITELLIEIARLRLGCRSQAPELSLEWRRGGERAGGVGGKGGVGALRRVEDGGSAAKAGNLRSYRIGGL